MTASPFVVLVVDDNDAARFGNVQLLRRERYRVLEAPTGREALRLAEHERVDLVLLDVHLPDISGLEVCRSLKQAGSNPTVQVLQLSSTAVSDQDRIRGLTGGADAYLTEPVHPQVLLATIEALLRVRRAELALAEALASAREARDEAERANRFKDEFLATLSHELRTPLSAMVGWIWQLRQGISDEDARRRALDGLERNTQTQVRLINDLLDVARIGKGKLELELGPVELGPIVEAAIESVQTSIKKKRLVVTVHSVAAQVTGDSGRLQQVVVNLLTNAIKFSREGGAIEIRLESTPTEAVIVVRDHGQGIVPSVLPHVFDQFWQADQGTARRHGGLGLGLSIARQLVQIHGGRVTAESEGPGLGATFTVHLPRTAAVVPAAAFDPARVRRALSGLRVLVVDDDPDSRNWLSALVESAGGQATAVASGDLALSAVADTAFDLLVSDIGMPGLDGIGLLGLLRSGGFDAPAVAVTAFSSRDDRARVLAGGYQEHFAKPVEPETFVARLAELGPRGPAPQI
jgi:signal transduction histidine kinase